MRLREVIQRADQDGLSYAKVFVDGVALGQTSTGARSQEKSWAGRVEPGNHPVRLELWVLPGLGAWERLADAEQPRERFVRVEAASRTRVQVLRRAGEGGYDFSVARDPF
ncbi:MAG: hypothetical protein HY554_12400 [Elusimicrobia bacterium]|nr:hypothetical protein [Elusimicrobiota bacterium]